MPIRSEKTLLIRGPDLKNWIPAALLISKRK